MKKIIVLLLILFTLCGCSSTVSQPVKEAKVPATELKPTAIINGNEVNIPSGYVVSHSLQTVKPSGTEREVLSFANGSQKECCVIRYATTTTEINNIEQADKVLKDFNTAVIYNSLSDNTVANEIKLLNDEKTYLLQGIAMDNDGLSYYINSFIEKGTKDLYSLCILYNPDMSSECNEAFLKSIYSDIGNIIYATKGEEKRFENYAATTIGTWCSTKKLEGSSTLEHITELTERELLPDRNYTLEEDNSVFTFEAVEGKGKIILTDERFGVRELLMGYGSINAPSLYEDVALVRNENIYIEGDVLVNLMRKKWKEN